MKSFQSVMLKIMISVLLVSGYVMWNYSDFLVWDDTAHSSYNIYANNKHYDIDNPKLLNFLFAERFGKINSDGYRPLSGILRGFGTAYFVNRKASLWPFLLLNGIVFSCLVFAFYSFSYRLSKDSTTSVLAVFLLLFSTPFLSGSMVRYAGIQALMPLLFLLIFISYFNSKKPHGQIKWFISYSFLLFLSAWMRELFIIVPVLIIFFEIYNKTWKSRELIAAILLLPHFIFPGAIPHWTAFPDLPVKSVFFMGALSRRLEVQDQVTLFGNMGALFSDIKWRIFLDLFSVLPTSIVLLAGLYGLYSLVKSRGKCFNNPNIVFLWSFFALTFLPLLKVFYEHLHLLYAMTPLSILVAIGSKNMVLLVKEKKLLLLLVGLLSVVSLFGHAMNPFIVRQGTHQIYSAIFRLSDYFVGNVAQNSIVVSNVHHLEDIRYYSKGHIDPWSAPGAIFNKKKWLGHTAADLDAFIKDHPERDIYLLDGKKSKVEHQLGGGREHSYAGKGMVETQSFGLINKVKFVYRYFDPLRALLPVENTEWIGPPDLEFDFYRGPALDNSFMTREVSINYLLYKVTDKTVFKWTPHPELLAGSIHNFNVIGFRNKVYAIPQNEGAFELKRLENGLYSKFFQGSSQLEVQEKIERFIKSGAPKNLQHRWPIHPKLLEQNVLHFNIVGFKDRVYAIPQSEGAFELKRIQQDGYSKTFEGQTLEKVRMMVLKFYSKQ
jgi:hypothetical protein